MPTPGVAPRKDARYADIRRRALDPRREPLPTRVEDVPDLPPGAVHALDEGLAALDLTLTPETRRAIEGHARLLLAWTSSINLTAIRDPEVVATAHIVDSLTAVEVLAAHGIGRFLDLGSGGGYPGLPLAAALPAERALLVEPIAKKARFLETVIASTGLTATVEAAADPGRGARRRPAPPQPVAGRHRSGRGAARRPRGAGLPAARPGRDPRSPGNAATSRTRWPPPSARCTPSVAAASRASRSSCPAWTATSWSW